MTTWGALLQEEKQQPYFQQILSFVEAQRASGKSIYPPEDDVFNAFRLTEFDNVKVVILGQDPYHGPDQAHGLCFSVQQGIKPPPSLANIYKELATDIPHFAIPNHGNLTAWAQQGVLMLNTVLTVEQGNAHSHAKIGWERFTDSVIEKLNQHTQNLVFMLWGSHAQKKGAMIDRNKHTILTAPHPSPLSAHRGFLGCKHFSKCNQVLAQQGLSEINWQI
jgi:uracil-DNA glycosylase